MTQPSVPGRGNRWGFPFLILGIAASCLLYRILVIKRLEQTSLLFVGIPVILAFIIACTPKAETVTVGILKGTTLFLLLSAPLLGEGFICIIMASPIFLAVALVIGIIIDAGRKRRKQTTVSCVALVVFLPMALEGSHAQLSFNREEQITVRRIINASP